VSKFFSYIGDYEILVRNNYCKLEVLKYCCYGFAWQDFGSGRAIGVASVRS